MSDFEKYLLSHLKRIADAAEIIAKNTFPVVNNNPSTFSSIDREIAIQTTMLGCTQVIATQLDDALEIEDQFRKAQVLRDILDNCKKSAMNAGQRIKELHNEPK